MRIVWMRVITACWLSLGLATGAALAADAAPAVDPDLRIGLHTTVLKVVRDGSEGDPGFAPVADLASGDELRYAIRFRNDGTTSFGPGRVQVQTPMPAGTQYVPGSAGGKSTRIEFAPDGVTFGPESHEPLAEDAGPPTVSEAAAAPDVATEPTLDEGAVAPALAAATTGGDEAAADTTSADETLPDGMPAARSPAEEPGGDEVPSQDTPSAPAEQSVVAEAPAAGALVIRWTYEASLAPGDEGEVHFHVVFE